LARDGTLRPQQAKEPSCFVENANRAADGKELLVGSVPGGRESIMSELLSGSCIEDVNEVDEVER